ncbi:hypothetical protein [Streptomyces olivaceoviridis]
MAVGLYPLRQSGQVVLRVSAVHHLPNPDVFGADDRTEYVSL